MTHLLSNISNSRSCFVCFFSPWLILRVYFQFLTNFPGFLRNGWLIQTQPIVLSLIVLLFRIFFLVIQSGDFKLAQSSLSSSFRIVIASFIVLHMYIRPLPLSCTITKFSSAQFISKICLNTSLTLTATPSLTATTTATPTSTASEVPDQSLLLIKGQIHRSYLRHTPTTSVTVSCSAYHVLRLSPDISCWYHTSAPSSSSLIQSSLPDLIPVPNHCARLHILRYRLVQAF